MYDSEGLNRKRLLLSIFISIPIWWFIFGKLTFAVILIASLLIHEFGHYFWMGREGIRKRDMMMIPPLGAVAITKEGWPSYGAEARIALAGPIVGFIPGIVFFYLGQATGNKMWFASASVVAIINLFNLLPIAPLDGGRCFRSILVSFHPSLRIVSHALVIAGCFLLFFLGSFIFPLLILTFWWLEERHYWWARRNLRMAKAEIREINGDCHAYVSLDKLKEKIMEKIIERKLISEEEELERVKSNLRWSFKIVSMKRMDFWYSCLMLTVYFSVILAFFYLFGYSFLKLNLNNGDVLGQLSGYF